MVMRRPGWIARQCWVTTWQSQQAHDEIAGRRVTLGEPLTAMPALDCDRVIVEALITLATCADLFRSDDRLVAFGQLLSSRPVDSGRSATG